MGMPCADVSHFALVQQQVWVRCPSGFQQTTDGKALTVKYMMVLIPAACCSTCSPTPATPSMAVVQQCCSTGISIP